MFIQLKVLLSSYFPVLDFGSSLRLTSMLGDLPMLSAFHPRELVSYSSPSISSSIDRSRRAESIATDIQHNTG